MKMNYVVGFLFSIDRKHVTLVKKNKPEWQKGRWNGVGGKVEEGEWTVDAMRREFLEETGTLINDWFLIARMEGFAWDCHVFRAFFDAPVSTMTDETIGVWPVEDVILQRIPVISNLPTLIAHALDENEGDELAFLSLDY